MAMKLSITGTTATPANDDSVHTSAHLQLFSIAYKAAVEVDKVIRKHVDNIIQWLQVQYGDTPPTYDQFWDDRDALKALAKERGLTNDQSVRKPYNAAVRQLYGEQILELTAGRSALPVSTTKEAVAKRMATKAPAKKAKVGAAVAVKSTRTANGMPSDAEAAIRMVLERFGFGAVLMAFSRILAEKRETATEAKRLAALVDKPGVDQRTHNTKVPVHKERRHMVQ